MDTSINKILREELIKERTNYVLESYKPILNENNESFLNTTFKLLNEGYDLDEIDHMTEGLFDGEGFLGKIGQAFRHGTAGKTVLSSLKEQVIRWFLNKIDLIPGGAVNFMSATMADLPVSDIFGPFKSPEACRTSAPKIVSSMFEGLMSFIYAGRVPSEDTKKFKDQITIPLTNYLGELLRDSDIDDAIGNTICEKIWANKN